MAETFFNEFTDLGEYGNYDSMGLGPDELVALYPAKNTREVFLRTVRGLFTSRMVSYQEAGDLLRLGEDEGEGTDEVSPMGSTIYEGLAYIHSTPVEQRQSVRAALFAAAAAGA